MNNTALDENQKEEIIGNIKDMLEDRETLLNAVANSHDKHVEVLDKQESALAVLGSRHESALEALAQEHRGALQAALGDIAAKDAQMRAIQESADKRLAEVQSQSERAPASARQERQSAIKAQNTEHSAALSAAQVSAAEQITCMNAEIAGLENALREQTESMCKNSNYAER